MYELQLGRKMSKRLRRITIRITEKEKNRIEKIENIIYDALKFVSWILLGVVIAIESWVFVCGMSLKP